MDDLATAFRRNPDGSWSCLAPVTIEGPNCAIHIEPGSTFSPGTRVEGLDVAAWIEERASRDVWRSLAHSSRPDA